MEFEEIWLDHSKVSKICTLMSSIWQKYIIFQENLKKNWLAVYKMTWPIWHISPEHSKVSE